MCEILGFEPLYIGNEGKLLVIVSDNDADLVLKTMKNHPMGKDSEIIGEVIKEDKNLVYLRTYIGGKRILNMPTGELLPRI